MTARSPGGLLVAFERATIVVPIDALILLKNVREDIRKTNKFQQIAASILAVGLIEPPVVIASKERGQFYLLDGALRVTCLKDRGDSEVECLVATDDEAYTYNKRISRLAGVQEHRMIAKAVEKGATLEQIGLALGLNVQTMERKSRMLRGICDEVVSLLQAKECPQGTFDALKAMTPLRQIEAAELMCGQNNFSLPFARAILAATPETQLVKKSGTKATEVSREQILRLERELASIQHLTRNAEDTYGGDNLTLTITRTYLTKLIRNTAVHRWLRRFQPDYLAEFQTIAELPSIEQGTGPGGGALSR